MTTDPGTTDPGFETGTCAKVVPLEGRDPAL